MDLDWPIGDEGNPKVFGSVKKGVKGTPKDWGVLKDPNGFGLVNRG